MKIRLGDLTVAEVERRHQLTLPDDVRLELESMRQEDAQEIEDGKFHISSLPTTTFSCGSEQTHDYVLSLLANYRSGMVGRICVSFEGEPKEDEQKR